VEVEKFDISFTHAGRKFSALCEKFQVHNYPQIWVAVKRKSDANVFTFYKVADKGKMMFWFPLPGRKHLMAKDIAKRLQSYFNG
jgi:hypothetical protein